MRGLYPKGSWRAVPSQGLEGGTPCGSLHAAFVVQAEPCDSGSLRDGAQANMIQKSKSSRRPVHRVCTCRELQHNTFSQYGLGEPWGPNVAQGEQGGQEKDGQQFLNTWRANTHITYIVQSFSHLRFPKQHSLITAVVVWNKAHGEKEFCSSLPFLKSKFTTL